MKTVFLVIFLLIGVVTTSFSQCDKKIILRASKSQLIDASGAIQDTKDGNTTIEISKTEMTVSTTIGNRNFKQVGNIKSKICNWKVPFKDGKTVVNIILKYDADHSKDSTITIEGKDGKVTLFAEISDVPSMQGKKIKLNIEKFEEEN